MAMTYDVIIIGGGVVGNAIARELSRYHLSVAVLEKEPDICMETSARNSGVVHAGFNYAVGSLKAQCCVEGCRDFHILAEELDIPFKRTGKVLVGFSGEDRLALHKAKALGEANGVAGLEIIEKDRLRDLLPHVEGEFAMYSPQSGIVNPFIYTIALAENAARNGVTYVMNAEVTETRYENGVWLLGTAAGEFRARWVVNAAGLGSAAISSLLGIPGYRLGLFKGEYVILDSRMGRYLSMPVYPVPNPVTGMGVHVTPSVDGNVLIGPDSQKVADPEDYATSAAAMGALVESARMIFPCIERKDYIRCFAGTRPKLVDADGTVLDFVVESRPQAPSVINLVGIESPGLTAAVPLAKRAVALLVAQERPESNAAFVPERKGFPCFKECDHTEQARLIQENPEFGEIICRCETVTKAEIRHALTGLLPAATMMGVKNRTRAMMGRCQGGYCEMRISTLLRELRGQKCSSTVYSRRESNMFVEELRP